MKLTFVESRSLDPYYNLALEGHLLHCCREGERILYLWQNERTVVLGRNQDAESECPVELLKRDGIHLARRSSGGGAVYHDRENLNYTFLARERDYDVPGQLEVVLSALREIGIPAEFSGRNDILAHGRKVSGNAFFTGGGSCCHHGTLMVGVDLAAAERYLRPKGDKLAAHGVPSVRSRVANLREFRPGLKMDELKQALRLSFERRYGGYCDSMSLSAEDLADIGRRRETYADRRWIYGESGKYGHGLSRRFAWGEVTLRVRLDRGVVADVQADTDAMEPGLPEALRERLLGVPFENRALYEAVLKPDAAAVERAGDSGRTDEFGMTGIPAGVREEIAGWLLEGQLGG